MPTEYISVSCEFISYVGNAKLFCVIIGDSRQFVPRCTRFLVMNIVQIVVQKQETEKR